MRRVRHTTAALFAVLAMAGMALSGCGAVSHAVGGIVAHKAANHLLGQRNANKVFCLYHGHRVLVDLRTRHVFATGINAYEAYRSCRGGFGHHR